MHPRAEARPLGAFASKLPREFSAQERNTCDVFARPIHAANDPVSNWIICGRKHDWYRSCGPLRCTRDRGTARRD